MTLKSHWEHVYETKSPTAVSWFAPHLVESLRLIRSTNVRHDALIVDVGGGESTLVDDLLSEGYRNIEVLDISEHALKVCQRRLGTRALSVKWTSADVLSHSFLPQSVDVWHDRAVFHFLTTPEQRHQYVDQVLRALKPGGFCIVGTFGPEGPEQCSGLLVQRYGPDDLHGQFGEAFNLLEHSTEVHKTPWGSSQQFVYCLCRRDRVQVAQSTLGDAASGV